MRLKFFYIVLIVFVLAAASPAYAKSGTQSFFNRMLGALVNAVENIIPSAPLPDEVKEEAKEELVDPREVQQVLRELRDINRELKRFAKQLAKLPNSSDDVSAIHNLITQVENYRMAVNSGENLRDAIQDFRDAQMWDELNKFRAKVEVPKEMKNWNKEIKKIEKLLKQKKIQNASSEFGFDLEGARTKIQELKVGLSNVQEYYSAGDLESAIEEFDGLRQELQPWDLGNVLQRFNELAARLKKVKDQQIKEQVKETLSEIVSNFNDGDYQLARELMEENFNDLLQIIFKASGGVKNWGKKYDKEGMMDTMEKIENKMKEKIEEKKIQKEPESSPATDSTQTQVPIAPPAPEN